MQADTVVFVLKRERDAARLMNSRFLAELSRQQNEASDFGTALALSLEAISDPNEAIGTVIAPQAVSELDRAARSMREYRVLRGHEARVRSVVRDPAGGRALTGSDDGTARLWEAATGDELAVLRGHEDFFYSAVFDRSETRVLTASADGTAGIWDVATGTELAVLRGHEGAIVIAVFDSSGERMLTASEDKTARIWRVFSTVAALVDHARAISPRALTREQRQRFFLE